MIGERPDDRGNATILGHLEGGMSACVCAFSLTASSFLFLVVRPGAPSSVLALSSDARSPVRSFLFPKDLPQVPA